MLLLVATAMRLEKNLLFPTTTCGFLKAESIYSEAMIRYSLVDSRSIALIIITLIIYIYFFFSLRPE